MADHNWEGDINEAVVEEWIEETTPFDRVREVLASTTTPQYAGEIADRARVSEPSARKHLRTLAESGIATTRDTDRGTQFKRSRETVAMQRIRELHETLGRDDLVEGIRDLKDRIAEHREEYDVTDPDDLALELEADDEGWAAIAEWRSLEEDLKLAQAALSLYDFDPDDTGSERSDSGDGSTRGSFAGTGDGLSA